VKSKNVEHFDVTTNNLLLLSAVLNSTLLHAAISLRTEDIQITYINQSVKHKLVYAHNKLNYK